MGEAQQIAPQPGSPLLDRGDGIDFKPATPTIADDAVIDFQPAAPPDMAKTKAMFQENYQKAADAEAPKGEPAPKIPEVLDPTRDINGPADKRYMSGVPGLAPSLGQQPAKTLAEHIEASWGMTIAGLVVHGGLPDKYIPEDSPRYMKIVGQLTQLVIDSPFMWFGGALGQAVGGLAGAGIGTVTLPGVGSVGMTGVGAAAGRSIGTFMVPAAIRGVLIDHYVNGDIRSFDDWFNRSASLWIDSGKEGLIGLASLGTGKLAGTALGRIGAGAVTKTTGSLMAEAAAMTTMGDLLQGHMPKNWDSFLDAAIVMGVTHSIPKVAGKMAEIYKKVGILPDKVVEMAKQDPAFKQELLSENKHLPPQLEPFVDPAVKKETAIEVKTEGKSGEDVMGPVEDPGMKIEPLPEKDPVLAAKEKFDEAEQRSVEAKDLLAKEEAKDVPDLAKIKELKAEELKRDQETEGRYNEWKAAEKSNPLLAKLTEERGSVSNEPTNPPKEPQTDLEKARAEMATRIVERPEQDSWTFLGLVDKEARSKFYENVFDRFDPVKKLVAQLANGKVLKVAEDAYKLFRLAVDAGGKAQHFLKFGALDFNTLEKVAGVKSVKEILEPHKKDRENLTQFLVAARALELHRMSEDRVANGEKPIEVGIKKETAQLIHDAGKAKYGKAAQELVDYQNALLKYLKDSGRLSQESFDIMTEGHKAYIPWHRLMEDTAAGAKRTAATQNPIKNLFGSKRAILDPVESIILNTFEYTRLAENNRAYMGLIKLAEQTPDQKLLVRQKTPIKGIKVKADEVAKFLAGEGVSSADAEAIAADFTIYRRGSIHLKADEIVVWREGKPEIHKAADEGVARSFQALEGDAPSMGMLWKLMSIPAATLRATISLTPDFIARNFIRDQITAGTFQETGNPFRVAFESVRALGDLWSENQVYQNWLKSGGGTSSFVSVDRDYIRNDIFELNKGTDFMSSAFNVLRHPLEQIRAMSELVENSTRLAEFKRVTKGKTDSNSVMEGGFSSREVTVDFQRMGAKMKAWNQITAFFNVGFQGTDRTLRSFKDRPAEFLLRTGALVTLPSLYVAFAAHGDKRFDEIPRWQRDMFWCIAGPDKWEPIEAQYALGKAAAGQGHLVKQINGEWHVNNGVIYRVPKPGWLGLAFGSLPERVVSAFWDQNPKAFKDFGDTFQEAVIPNFSPTGPTAVLEHVVNHSFFTKNKLVPTALETLSGYNQVTPYTTESAKLIGGMLGKLPFGVNDLFHQNMKVKGSSPIVVEHYVQAMTGNFGKYMLELADKAMIAGQKVANSKGLSVNLLPPEALNKPETHFSEWPFVRAFTVRNPTLAATSIRDFQDTYSANSVKFEDIRHSKATGNYGQMAQELQDLANHPETIVRLQGIDKSISMLQTFVRKVSNNPSMPPHDKRQLIDNAIYGMIKMAESGNKAFEDIKKRANQKK